MVIRGLLGELIMRVLCISLMSNWIVTSQRFLFNESSDNLVEKKEPPPSKLSHEAGFSFSPSGSYWAVPQHSQAALIDIHFLTLRMTSMISLMSEYLFLCICGLCLSLCDTIYQVWVYCCGVSCVQRPLSMVCSKVESTAFVCAIFGAFLAEKWPACPTSEPSWGESSNASSKWVRKRFLLLLSCQETSCSLLQICELQLLFS